MRNLNVKADKGMIHDMDGIGHWVPIRWYFSKDSYDLSAGGNSRRGNG